MAVPGGRAAKGAGGDLFACFFGSRPGFPPFLAASLRNVPGTAFGKTYHIQNVTGDGEICQYTFVDP